MLFRSKLPLLLAVVSFLLYANTLGHGFVLDDYSLILENRITKMGTSAIPEIFQTGYRSGYFMKDDGLYRPLVKSMFATEWQWGGGSPVLFHWMNVLLYSLTGFVLYRMLFRLTKGNVFVSFVASLLFICHPIHTEVVANIKSRDEILAFLFCVWSLDSFMNWAESSSKFSLLVSSCCFFLALLSKESAITLLDRKSTRLNSSHT